MAIATHPTADRRPLVAAIFPLSWRYSGGKRDARLDLLRGFAAFAMVVDHVGHVTGNRAPLYAITGGNSFYVSAAEAFVLISGLVMGIVYAGIVARDGVAAAVRKSLRRAGTLYLVTVALTLSFAALSLVLRLSWAPTSADGSPLTFIVEVLTLRRAYYLADVMLLYTLLVLAAGPLFALLARGRTHWVLAGSWGLWGLWQLSPVDLSIPWPIVDNSTFQFASWQVLFINAMVIGFHRRRIEQRLRGVSPYQVLVVSGVIAAASIAAYATLFPAPPFDEIGDTAAGRLLFDRTNVPAGRILAVTVFMVLGFVLTTAAWDPIRRSTGWLLAPLGENALIAYVAQVYIVALFAFAKPAIAIGPQMARTTAFQIMGLLLVWAVVKLWPRADALRARLTRRPVRDISSAGETVHAPQPTPGTCAPVRRVPARITAGSMIGPAVRSFRRARTARH